MSPAKTAVIACLAALIGSPAFADDQANAGKVFQCLGWAAESGDTAEGAAFRPLAALALTLPAKDEFSYEVPAFRGQSEDFWRGYMIASLMLNATVYVNRVNPGDPKSVAQQMFAKQGCGDLIK